MIPRPLIVAASAALFVVAGLFQAAQAAERKPFDTQSFAQAQAANAPILVDIAADWCPTCRAQKPIIDGLAADPANEALVIFEVDFDNQRDVVRAFRTQSQSTLIAFRGSEETGRSVGDTNAASIAALVKTAVAR